MTLSETIINIRRKRSVENAYIKHDKKRNDNNATLESR
jgi:hypothetical protein